MDMFEGWPGDNPDTKLREVHELFYRYGRDISTAIKAMQFKYDDPNYCSTTAIRLYLFR